MNRRAFLTRATPAASPTPPAPAPRPTDDRLEGLVVQWPPVTWPAGLRPAPAPAAPAPRPRLAATPSHAAPRALATGLAPQPGPLSAAQAHHLLRRTGCGAPAEAVDALAGRPAAEAAAELVADALQAPPLPRPAWVDTPPPARGASQEERRRFQENNGMWLQEVTRDWARRLQTQGLRERMTLFWSNHFVTELETYILAPVAFRYLDLLHTHALGNFRAFVHAVGLSPAMLVYLNGHGSTAAEPNENYARELLELFTMGQLDAQGQANYTQHDIDEISRALTGWLVDYNTYEPRFFSRRFDTGQKTVFGQTGAFGYDEVVALLFEQRGPQIAAFVCEKLYRAFVYDAPNPAVVEALAAELVAADFELAPVVTTLLQSAHFFDAEVAGAAIKSPMDFMLGLLNAVRPEPPDEVYVLLDRVGGALLEQRLLSPPNVAGWPGHHAWVTTNTLPLRWLVSDFLLFGDGRGLGPADLTPLAEQVSDPTWDSDQALLSPFFLPEALAAFLLPVPLEQIDFEAQDVPFAGDLTQNPIPQAVLDAPPHVQALARLFLQDVPWYEWNLYQPDLAPFVLLRFARYLTQRPEYQLA